MRVLFCSSEIYPYVKTGGLGDVTAALPQALIAAGADVRLFLPGYKDILPVLRKAKTLIEFPVYFGEPNVRVIRGMLPEGIITYVLDAAGFWDRSSAYVDESGKDWADNHYRFAAFCRAAADLAAYEADWRADILHGNDWQCGLIAPYTRLKGGAFPKTVMTVHNIAYQGLFAPDIMPAIGIPAEMYTMNGAEFYNKIGYLKAGLAYSDHITTVSPTYAREIQETEQGCGLQDFLKSRSGRITGLLNGIDTAVWNSQKDKEIAQRYDAESLGRRAKNKALLHEEFGLNDLERPLFSIVSRLGYQKGFDLFLDAVPRLLERGGNLIVLGSGDRSLEEAFQTLAAGHPGRIAARIGYDENLAHRLQAGSDVIVMPSRSEPCGLVQLYALRYGALPFVRKTGGLADTVTDAKEKNATGFVFEGESSALLIAKLDEIFDCYADKRFWEEMQKRGMADDHSWRSAAESYTALYRSLLSASGNTDKVYAR